MYKSSLYKKSPIFLQELMINIKSIIFKLLRENWLFKKRIKELHNNQYISREKLLEQQRSLLKITLDQAKEHVSFYKNVKSSNIDDFPLIGKEDIRIAPCAFLNDSKKFSYTFKSQTGGTTGKPLNLYSGLSAIIEDHAQSHRQLTWAGYLPGDKRVWLRADLIVPLEQNTSPYWRHNRIDKMLMMSVYHLSEETVRQYLEKLHNYKPKIIQAYPSAIFLFANLIESLGLAVNLKIKGIVLSSESCSDNQKLVIERVFNCKVFSWYGLSERVATAGTCKYGKMHLIEDYGYYEFSDDKLIATGFHNSKMPLIRYNTEDIFSGVSSEFNQCECGLPFLTIKSIQGREGEFLLSTSGRKVLIFNHIPKNVCGLVELQLKQKRIDEIIALVVVDRRYDQQSEKILEKNIKTYFGEDMRVLVKKVSSIPRTKNGKFRQAILELEP